MNEWDKRLKARLDALPPPDDRCEYAKQFQTWTYSIIPQPPYTLAIIYQNYCLLLMQWLSHRAASPREHQNYTGNEHTCLYHVMIDTAQRLKLIELQLTPPLYMAQTEPAQPVQPAELPPSLIVAEVRSTYGNPDGK